MKNLATQTYQTIEAGIVWENHDEGDQGMFQTRCGRFETSLDPVYGYLRLHVDGDTSESIHESPSLTSMTRAAAQVLAREQGVAVPCATPSDFALTPLREEV
ncbi:hypothetical protein ACOI1H_16145 [Loktanella sp. DJP18]|uniref:hypothetical protein n=1 Tax=Loktanella sp. DJP18 TaxID=3409788 RepID=UPI003BB74BC8